MRWIQQLRLRGKLAIILVLPLAGLILVSTYVIQVELQQQRSLQRLESAGRYAQAITALLHELQQERGRSASFVSSQSDHWNIQMVQQRALSDRQWQRLQELLHEEATPDSRLNSELFVGYRSVIETQRQQIDAKQATAYTVVAGFSRITSELLSAVSDLARYSDDPQIGRFLDSYQLLVQATELLGLERAEASVLIEDGQGEFQIQHLLLRQQVEQQLLLAQSGTLAPEVLRTLFSEAAGSRCAQQLNEMRLLINVNDRNRIPTSQQWFTVITCYIDNLQDIKIHLIQYIRKDIDQRLAAGRWRMLTILLFVLVPLLPTLLVIYAVVSQMDRSTRWLLLAMRAISSGDYTVTLPPVTADEQGQLSAGLDQLRQQLLHHQQEQQQLLWRERERNHQIALRISEVQAFAKGVASGDLRKRLNEDNENLQELAFSLNHMVSRLAQITGEVREGGHTLASIINQVQATINSQSAGASEQAASVNETLTTLEELRATSVQNLDKAHSLGEIANKAQNQGLQGREAVEESIDAMELMRNKMDTLAHTILSLNNWTQRIGEITSVVSEISRQLRLLSLNAAVGATRAGGAGKGFAVVALEVRHLSEQSRQANEQVQRILEEIRQATELAVMAAEDGGKGVIHSLQLVERAGGVLRNLDAVVQDTSLATHQIVAAVRQEVNAIAQIATAVSEIHTVTGEFVSFTSQSRDAIGHLGEVAELLEAAINRYRL
ncbi:MAG: methyl-accepting chemotaxis protein [Gammaproteobacteria bacterium]|nr:methyl-accepting chemotaxis protein [Gammaproteobacteria bacterium]